MLLLSDGHRDQRVVAQRIDEFLQGQAGLRNRRPGFEQDKVDVIRRLPGNSETLGQAYPAAATRSLKLFEIFGCKLPVAEIQNRMPCHQILVASVGTCPVIFLMLRDTGQVMISLIVLLVWLTP